jgi:hypothetical protein
LGWVRTGTEVRKFRIDDLRANGFWSAVATGRTTSQPVVVLTDRKDAIIQAQPFALAYEVFRTRLLRASHWCIAGYSFSDVPVNRALGDAIAIRRSLAMADPRLLVLGHGDETEIAERVAGALSTDDPGSLLVDGHGLPDSVLGERWEQWAAA